MTENIEVFTQSSIRINAGKILYFDPFQHKQNFNDADYIFITHDHYDHFSPDDIAKVVKEDTVFVVPAKLEAEVKKLLPAKGSIVVTSPGEKYEMDGFTVETVPAYNNFKPFHTKKAGWNGYIIVYNQTRIYVAGDTDANKDNRTVKCDVALVPIGGTYTMNAREAAEFINEIRPKVAIPTHYGSIVGSFKDANEFAEGVSEDIKVEIKIK
ncbi:MAG: MBL fold metallo-hydrolase [Lachnospiraceae bacterium]|nr:MBL fold metallo-hydrolase [Lachnospiraceae bacterium]